MSENEPLRPAVTVAAIVVRNGEFLVVEEVTRDGIRINQPAGHLEAGESLLEAVARETLEETGYRVRATALVGIYRWQSPAGATFVRFAFAADVVDHDPTRVLDDGILRAFWLGYDALIADSARHRSPLVRRCFDDFLAGRRLPLEFISDGIA